MFLNIEDDYILKVRVDRKILHTKIKEKIKVLNECRELVMKIYILVQSSFEIVIIHLYHI